MRSPAAADAENVASPDPEVSEAASAEEPEAAPVKPSAAAVSPKSRTRRRKKGDDEEKELFPFYEQSLF